MTAATLAEVLQPAVDQGYAVAGFVVLGWEDASAYVDAAECTGSPLILQAGPGCRAHTPLPILGKMFRQLADSASVPVVCHIDHANSYEECVAGIEHGFTSVMFDGSELPLEENIAKTGYIVDISHKNNVSVEGEIGYVGYHSGKHSSLTDVGQAQQFAAETQVDAMAIAVGNVHLQTEPSAIIDWSRLSDIESVTQVPLVLHGGSGIPVPVRQQLARHSRVCKFNIGTELRQTFGSSLRKALADNPDWFDRNRILSAVKPDLRAQAAAILNQLRFP